MRDYDTVKRAAELLTKAAACLLSDPYPMKEHKGAAMFFASEAILLVASTDPKEEARAIAETMIRASSSST